VNRIRGGPGWCGSQGRGCAFQRTCVEDCRQKTGAGDSGLMPGWTRTVWMWGSGGCHAKGLTWNILFRVRCKPRCITMTIACSDSTGSWTPHRDISRVIITILRLDPLGMDA